MTVQWETVDVPIGTLNTQRDPKQGPVGRLLKADNVVMARQGELKLRNGFRLQGTVRHSATAVGGAGTTNTAGRGLASYGGKLLAVFEDDRIAQFSPNFANGTFWVNRTGGADWNMAPRRWESQLGTAFRSDSDAVACDIATNPTGTHALVAWTDGATIGRYAIVELATEALIYVGEISNPTQVANPRCVWDSTGLYCAVFWTYAGSEIRCNSLTWDTAALRVSAASFSANLIGAVGVADAKNYDATVQGGNYYLVWSWWDGVAADYVASWLSVPVGTVTPSAITRGTHPMGTATATNGSRLAFARPGSTPIRVVARGQTQTYRYFTFDASTLVQGALTTTAVGLATNQRAATLSAQFASSTLRAAFGSGAESDSAVEMSNTTDTATGITGKMATCMVMLGTSYAYLLGCYDQAQPTAYLVIGGSYHAIVLPSVCEVPNPLQTWEWLPQLRAINDDLLVTVMLQNVAIQGTSTTPVYRSIPRLVRLVRKANLLGQVAHAADALLVAGGNLIAYDGARTVTNNPIVYPETPGATGVGAPGKTAGTYKVRTVWAWTDNAGRIHRSAPSLPATVVLGGVGSIQVQADADDILRPNVGSRAAPSTKMSVEFYCTTAGGDTYYLERTEADPENAYTLSTSDAVLQTREVLYTTGGALDNFPFPSLSAIAHWQNRVWGVSSERPERIYFSHEIRDGEGVASHPTFWLEAADAEGGFVALAQTDRALVALKRNAIYAITGDGPNRLGQGAFSIQQVSTGHGASSAEAVAAIPEGVLFRGDRGICLLDRGLTVSYVGAPVEEQLGSRTIVGTAVMPARSLAAFVTSDGFAFVWDWLHGQWYRWTLPQTSIVACCEHSGYLAFQDSTGRVYIETEGQLYDSGNASFNLNAIVPTVEFAPLQLSGIAGFWRLREVLAVGQRDADSRLTASLRYDYSTTVSQTIAGDMTTTKGAMARFKPARQKAAAIGISLALSWPNAPNYGAGFRLSGLTLVVARKRGGNKGAAQLTA